MTPEQVKEVVKITLDELMANNLIKDEYAHVNKVVSTRLYNYFGGNEDKELSHSLQGLADDPYIDVIYLQYRDELTLEYIAEAMDREVGTVKRNKKRLIQAIYKNIKEDS